MKQYFRSLCALAISATFFFSGCGGGGGGSALPGGGAAAGGPATATFQISIPQTQSNARTPHYVSPNTQSVSIAMAGGALTLPAGSPCTLSGSGAALCNTTGSSSGCTSSGGTLSCSFTVVAPTGNQNFTVTMFSGTGGGGSQLSTGQISVNVVSGTNNVPITLNGVVASIAVSLQTTSPPQGSSATIPVTVTAKDPSGATIIGPGNYTNPITLSDSDTSGATSLSTTTVNAPGAPVTLNYNGSASLASAIISASASGVSASAVTAATLTPQNVTHSIAGSSSALAIFTDSQGRTFAFVPSPTGVTQIQIASPSGVLARVRHTSAAAPPTVPPTTLALSPVPSLCTADPGHAKIYCAAFSSAVINVVDLSSGTPTLAGTYTTDAPGGGVSFSGGSCVICGLIYDPTDKAIIIATSTGYELYSAFPANAKVSQVSAPASENFGYNASTDQIFSPQYFSGTGIDLIDVAKTARYTLTPTPSGISEPDQGAVDTSTNLAITSNEFGSGNSDTVYMVDLSKQTLNSPATGQFTAPVANISLTSSTLSSCDTGIDDIAVDSSSHLAFFTGEFCGPGPIGVAKMPSAAGGALAFSDWAFVNMPGQPDGQAWSESFDPHAISTFNLPGVCADCGAIFNSNGSSSNATYTAIVDLNKLLSAARDTTDTHLVANNVDLICSGIVTFIPTSASGTSSGASGCATASQAVSASGGTFTTPSVQGFSATTSYPANASSGATFALTGETDPPPYAANTAGNPYSGNAVFFGTINPSANVPVTSGSGFNLQSITVPSWFPTGKTYTAWYYDTSFGTNGAYCGNNTFTLSGTTLTPNGGGASGPGGVGSGCINPPSNIIIPANHNIMVVLTYQ